MTNHLKLMLLHISERSYSMQTVGTGPFSACVDFENRMCTSSENLHLCSGDRSSFNSSAFY
uniref:Uncharacterized protein n=1 Tax=Anguilla anguilla TaxID=7936 RepID=A0A0E9TS53_ANGAN